MPSAVCRRIRDSCARALDRCYRLIPCLSDPARRSSLGLKAALVTLHLVFVGVLFLFDTDLVEKWKHEPWYTGLYLFLFVATLVQYFITSGSSPGYVIDAMRYVNETNDVFRNIPASSNQPASSTNGNLVITMEGSQPGRSLSGINATSWTKLVLEMYPPGTSVRLRGQSIVMTVTDAFFSLIIIVFGLGLVLAMVIIADFGGTFAKRRHCACGLAFCILHT